MLMCVYSKLAVFNAHVQITFVHMNHMNVNELCSFCVQKTHTWVYNNNNEYLEHLTRTGLKRLHVLYKYTLSKFNAYNMNAHTHTLMTHL